ncbi:coagulation factor VIII isoform X1 [Hypomesus transpacificus]|uniref:coagulation factor VIII isoform X1 n=1 Tax=Hypomesus transpacificus TaxID=137520 RepID=UPI001F072556|nr:coagulation factor VIII isoform X1 [Hypomesus transpacificus]
MRRFALLLLLFFLCGAGESSPVIREFHIAAVEIGWDYVHLDVVDTASGERIRSKDAPQKYIKAVYREYTDATYSVPKSRPTWAGIQGPVIHAQASDRVVIHFKNLASQPYSISPVGVTYWKQSEGAGYEDSTAGQEKQDDAVPPGGYYQYVWDISPRDGPTSSDPDCLTYSYSSQVDSVRDFNSGLIGALLVCKSSAFTKDGVRRSREFILIFAVFDETKSWYGEIGERRFREKFKKSSSRKQYHTINGYINSTLPGLTMCQSRDYVFWHLIGMGTAPEIHSIQFQDHTLQVMSHRKVSLEMSPMTFTTAEMKPSTAGRFLISCQINAHRHEGMNALFTVEDCPEPVTIRPPDRRQVNPNNDDKDYIDYYGGGDYGNGEELFSTLVLKPVKVTAEGRSSKGGRSKTWVHYIAAEEVNWDYAPHLRPGDKLLSSEFFPSHPQRRSYQYKKVVYVEYTDIRFTTKKTSSQRLLGPLLKGEINDQFQIIFKNLASRPFNMYPNGLTRIYPLRRTDNVAEKDLRSMQVPPNGTFGYLWRLTSEDGPLEGDPQCLTRLYQSTVDPERDLASGLVGPLLICKHQAINRNGKLVGPDRDESLMFAVFDENRSWYANENIQKYSQAPNMVNPSDPDSYNANVIYSVNGIMFSGRQFLMCKSDVTYWHVANVGTQSRFLSVYFTGNLFQRDQVYESVLTLFPMSGEMVPVESELSGEWEISAFDSSLKGRGMAVRYTVRSCQGDIPLAENEETDDYDGFADYLDTLLPRGLQSQPRNRTVAVRVCKKPTPAQNSTSSQTGNTTGDAANDITRETSEEKLECEVKYVIMPPSEEEEANQIPLEVLAELERDGGRTPALVPQGRDSGPGNRRLRRQAAEREGEGVAEGGEGGVEGGKLEVEAGGKVVPEAEERGGEFGTETEGVGHIDGGLGDKTIIWQTDRAETQESNNILEDCDPLDPTDPLNQLTEGWSDEGFDQYLETPNHIQSRPEQTLLDWLDLDHANISANDTAASGLELSLEYDDYHDTVNATSEGWNSEQPDVRSSGGRYPSYYIAAQEVTWDYGIRTPPQLITPEEIRRGMRKFLPQYKKVVFRGYRDKDFQHQVTRGELQEHLGILGPLIRVEVNDLLTVTFKNMASRPYSLHLHGVYDRSQEGSLAGEPVPPGEVRVYTWRVSRTQGPTTSEFDCKAGAYYSTVDKEKDLHSGLVGPLVVCKPDTLDTLLRLQPGLQEYSLLFHTFDETQSWYKEENLQQYCTPPCHARPDDTWYQSSNKFAAINGYVAETLPGLLVAQHQPARWHLLNVGGDGEYHAVQFHGLPFSLHKKKEHRRGIYNLHPGVFGTVEMRPGTVGTWLVECTVGDHQLAGMRAKLLVYDPECAQPLGLRSGRIEDHHITASDSIDNWEPGLARLELSGRVNAWMGRNKNSWIQVDLQKPTLVHGLQTQGARTSLGLKDYFIMHFIISYSLDLETWTTYRGNSSTHRYIFNGNIDGSKVKENRLSPPIVGRYIRIQPITIQRNPALRLELLGCDVNSCSFPLGLQRGLLVPDSSFSASSFRNTWRHSWPPALARLHQEGSANAWRPKNDNPHEWLQVDFLKVKRLTGVVTQGAKSLLTQMMVTEFSVSMSDNGHTWSSVLDDNSQREKVFSGNSEPDEEVLTMFVPPLFGRYIRILPRGWVNHIALRLEFLGCDTQQRL